MRTLYHFIRLFCFSVIAFSFNSCDKEAELATSQNELIKPRTGSPGSFSVTNGMLNFPTIADFHQTVDYVLEDSTQMENFRSSFSIKTYNKKADIILDSLNNILQSPSAVSSFWPGYASYLDMTISSGDTLFSSKYGIWGDFLNLNNYIEIEGYLYKISDGKNYYYNRWRSPKTFTC